MTASKEWSTTLSGLFDVLDLARTAVLSLHSPKPSIRLLLQARNSNVNVLHNGVIQPPHEIFSFLDLM